MAYALGIEGLTKQFGDKTVVGDVSFTVQQGDVLGFLGPNGSNKTTTITRWLNRFRGNAARWLSSRGAWSTPERESLERSSVSGAMFQKEVADRILAEYNSKNYGRLSIISSWKMEIKKIIRY